MFDRGIILLPPYNLDNHKIHHPLFLVHRIYNRSFFLPPIKVIASAILFTILQRVLAMCTYTHLHSSSSNCFNLTAIQCCKIINSYLVISSKFILSIFFISFFCRPPFVSGGPLKRMREPPLYNIYVSFGSNEPNQTVLQRLANCSYALARGLHYKNKRLRRLDYNPSAGRLTMLSLYEVALALLMLVCALWGRYRLSGLEASFALQVEEETTKIDLLLSEKIRQALDEFEDFAEEVVPASPDPFEAMEIMRSNMINQVLGLGVEWIAKKFTNTEMGVHQLENVHKPPGPGDEAWQDVDAEHQPSEELVEIPDSM